MTKNKLMYFQKNTSKNFFASIFNGLLLTFIYLSFIVMLFYLTHNYYNVDGTSMQPTITNGQAVFVSMGEYYTYGDIVIGYNPNDVKIIKRVIGLGGDKISYVLNNQGHYDTLIVYKNTSEVVVLQESYVENKIPSGQWVSGTIYSSYYEFFVNKFESQKTFEEIEYNSETIKFLVIPENCVYVLGDNRIASIDCATYGAIVSSSITGNVHIAVEKESFYFWDILLYSFGLRGVV